MRDKLVDAAARAAAIDLVAGHYGESEEDLDQWHDDIRLVAKWTKDFFDAEEKQAKEDALPVSISWLLSLSPNLSKQRVKWMQFHGRLGRLSVSWMVDAWFVSGSGNEWSRLNNRGDLRRLLKAIRGVA